MSGLVESARTFARELSNFFFNILPNQERVTLERKLEEVAVELGVTVQQIKTSFVVMAMGGYLIFLNIFFFLLPVVFLFIFFILVAVRDL